MMKPELTRARVSRIALVNWKGLVYDELDLDIGVTALEGETGAGKTTVMIAAYIVLLPDTDYLSFKNVGESSGGGGGEAGIWGRLGRHGRSYAWLEIQLPRERVVAGVHIRRFSKPRLEIESYIFEKVPPNIALEDLVMHRSNGELRVPEPEELSTLALMGGAEMKAFGDRKKDYLGRLFELGITPLRMATAEERRNMNEMLHTCMMGGISNTLRSGLRDFLFSENQRLADTVRRMTQNIEACRLTRSQVERNEKLELEIRELYDSGQKTFLLALHGTKTWAAEARADVDGLVTEEQKLRTIEAEKKAALEQALDELRKLAAERQRLDGEREQSEKELQLAAEALRLKTKLSKEEAALDQAKKKLEQAQKSLLEHEQALAECQKREEAARKRHADAAKALASFQEGYRELARKVAAYEQALNQLSIARKELDQPSLQAQSVADRLRTTTEHASQLADRAHTIRLRLEEAEAHARRFEQGRIALIKILDREVLPENAADALVEVDEARRVDELSFSQLGNLEQRLEDAQKRAHQQLEVRREVRDIDEGIDSLNALQQALTKAEEADRKARAQIDEAKTTLQKLGLQRQQVETALQAAQKVLAPWQLARSAAGGLSAKYGPIESAEHVDTLDERLSHELKLANDSLRSTTEKLSALRERLRRLEVGASLPDHVIQARDIIGGDLVAEHFDEVPLDAAGKLEATLGPLAAGLVVRNAHDAAARLAEEKGLNPGENLWLLERIPSVDIPESLADGSVLVGSGDVWRVAQEPAVPVLGRAAREQACSDLKAEIQTQEEEAEKRAREAQQLDDDLRVLQKKLRPVAHLLTRVDPSGEISSLQETLAGIGKGEEMARASLTSAMQEVDHVGGLLTRIRALLPLVSFLDPPDYTRVAEELTAACDKARQAGERLARRRPYIDALAPVRDDLKRLPLTKESKEELTQEQSSLEGTRQQLARAIEALQYLERNLAALGWGHFVPVLAAETELKPTMEGELTAAEGQIKQAQAEHEIADQSRDKAQTTLNKENANHEVRERSCTELRSQLTETGVSEPSEEHVKRTQEKVKELREASKALERRDRQLSESKGRLSSEVEGIVEKLRNVSEQLEVRREDLKRRERVWQEFQEAARDESLDLVALLAQDPGVTGSPNLFRDASSGRQFVVSLLRRTQGTDELVGLYGNLGDGSSAVSHVRAWAALRRYLHRRIPPDISEAADVVQALADLGRRLSRLHASLKEREQDLRLDAGSISVTIQSQRRSAGNRIRELGQALSHVRFGSIRKISLEMKHNEKMNELLSALSRNRDLFYKDKPFEEVLCELFKSVGGGRVTADRLLDYRQYFNVAVEVERLDGERAGAHSDQMSTGEAIGVGAAVMMMVLRAWEEDSAKLRIKRGFGTLRFLFLDEATRLSRKSLLVLFDLCRRLEMQLLIAAPQVDRVEGATTYSLIRGEDADGREQVDIHGRRVVAHGVGG